MDPEIREVLKYAGLMGHEFCAVEMHKGDYRTCGECDSIEAARKMFGDRKGVRVFRQLPSVKGKPRRYEEVLL